MYIYLYIHCTYIIYIYTVYMPKVDSSSLEGWECMTCLPFLEAEVHSTWQSAMKSSDEAVGHWRDAFGWF